LLHRARTDDPAPCVSCVPRLTAESFRRPTRGTPHALLTCRWPLLPDSRPPTGGVDRETSRQCRISTSLLRPANARRDYGHRDARARRTRVGSFRRGEPCIGRVDELERTSVESPSGQCGSGRGVRLRGQLGGPACRHKGNTPREQRIESRGARTLERHGALDAGVFRGARRRLFSLLTHLALTLTSWRALSRIGAHRCAPGRDSLGVTVRYFRVSSPEDEGDGDDRRSAWLGERRRLHRVCDAREEPGIVGVPAWLRFGGCHGACLVES
jgi:hypothetical protein